MAGQPLLRRRGIRLALGIVLVLDVAVLGVDAYLLSTRSTTTVVDLDDALVRFRQSAAADTTVTSAPAGGAEVTGAPAGEPTTTPVGAPTSAPATSSSSVPTSAPATPKAGALEPPAPGVYRYRTSGGESVSLLGASHTYPAETYAVVRRTGGCGWELRAEVIAEHVDRREMCSGPDQILQLAQQRAVTFFGTTDGGTLRCDPPQVQHHPGAQVGQSRTDRCTDDGVVAEMVLRVVALGTRTVGGVTVDTVEVRIAGTMTGRVRGTSLDLVVMDARTGLPIEVERWVDTVADAFGTSIRYQEHAEFQLLSLTPRT